MIEKASQFKPDEQIVVWNDMLLKSHQLYVSPSVELEAEIEQLVERLK